MATDTDLPLEEFPEGTALATTSDEPEKTAVDLAPVFDVPLSTATALYSVWSFSRRPFWPAS